MEGEIRWKERNEGRRLVVESCREKRGRFDGRVDWRGRISLEQERKERGGAASPSGSLSLFGVRGANRGEPRDHLPLPPKEGRVDRQLARNGDFARLEVRGQN